MIFCLIGANGMMLRSIWLPLAFSYPATIARKEASSSAMKPWVHHTLAVLAAAQGPTPVHLRPTGHAGSDSARLSSLQPWLRRGGLAADLGNGRGRRDPGRYDTTGRGRRRNVAFATHELLYR